MLVDRWIIFAANGVSDWSMVLPLVAIMVLFYLILWRPERRKQMEHAAMLANLKKDDRVITSSGIYGVVTNVHREADQVTIKVDENTNAKIRVTLGSISRVLKEESPPQLPSSDK